MSLDNYVSITITRDSVGVPRENFGTPLLLSYNAAWVERVRTYTTFSELATDFGVNTVEYLAAQKLFGQSPRLAELKVGRCALKPTVRYAGSVSAGAAALANTAFSISVVGEGFSGTATFTSGGSPTNDLLVAGLVSALNGVSGNNYIAAVVDSGTSDTFTVTADAAGGWFSLTVADANSGHIILAMNHADPGVATDLAAIQNEDDDWYYVYSVHASKALAGAAAAYIETQKKYLVIDSDDTVIENVAVASSDDTFEDLFDLAYDRTAGWYHRDRSDFLGGALLGRCAPLDPGKVTFHAKTLSGVEAVNRTATQRANIVARNGNSYERIKARNLSYNGKSFSGEWMDVIRDLDYVEDDIGSSIFAVIAGNDKIPFTNEGIALIENALRGALSRAESAGIFAPGWAIEVPDVGDVSTENKTARILPDVKFSATLAGAIHKVNVIGVVSV